MNTREKVKDAAMQSGMGQTEFISVKELVLYPEIRKICEENTCRNYGTTWACPPAVGTLEECRERLNRYDTMLLFTSFQRQAIRLTVPPSPDYRVQFLVLHIFDHQMVWQADNGRCRRQPSHMHAGLIRALCFQHPDPPSLYLDRIGSAFVLHVKGLILHICQIKGVQDLPVLYNLHG